MTGIPNLTPQIMRRGDDLVMSIRVRGSFTEIFEIHDYPCDCQGTTITLNFNCRANGPLPIRLSVDPSCKVSMTAINLCPPKIEFSLENALYMRAHLIGHGERTFPGISFTAKVIRKPFHSLLFVVCPYAFLSLLSVLANGIRGTDPVVRSVRALHTLVIVLAAASYRVALSASLPNIGYLTMLDRYCLWACGVILLCALQSRIQMIRIGELTESDLQVRGTPLRPVDLSSPHISAAPSIYGLTIHIHTLTFALTPYSRLLTPTRPRHG